MRCLHKIIPALVVLFGLALPGYAAVLLDDTWAGGTHTKQNLPKSSAWYASTGPALTTTPKSMTLTPSPTNAIMAVTYFTTNATSPVKLGVGDTLTVSVRFTFSGMAPANKSQGFRFGLFNFADSDLSPKRVDADKFGNGSQGDGVQGYALFQNMGDTFRKSNSMDIRKRDTIGGSSLLGSSRDWTSLITGPGDTSTFPGFANGTPYMLQLTLQRTGTNSLSISATWLNTASGTTISTSVTDDNKPTFDFDGIALRPQSTDQTASTITFNEIRVELAPAPKQ